MEIRHLEPQESDSSSTLWTAPLNRKNLALPTLAFASCFIAGVMLTFATFGSSDSSLLLSAFFGFFSAIFLGKTIATNNRASDMRAGMVIRGNGCWINGNSLSWDFAPDHEIPWNELGQVRIVREYSETLIVIHVSPSFRDDLFSRLDFSGIGGFTWALRVYGSPVVINESRLRCNLVELKNMIAKVARKKAAPQRPELQTGQTSTQDSGEPSEQDSPAPSIGKNLEMPLSALLDPAPNVCGAFPDVPGLVGARAKYVGRSGRQHVSGRENFGAGQE